MGKWRDSSGLFFEVIESDPTNNTGIYGYARSLIELGDAHAALPYARKALQLYPDDPTVMITLGRALTATGDYRDAAELLTRASEIDPDSDESWRFLGRLCVTCGKYEMARTCWENLLICALGDSEALAGLVRSFWNLGDVIGTLVRAKEVIDSGQASYGLHCFWLYIRLYDPALTAADLKQACVTFARKYATATPRRTHARVQSPQRKLRIGYVSSEFSRGAAYYFLHPLITNHDRDAFDIYLYDSRGTPDAYAERIRATGHWRDASELFDDAFVRCVRDDEIDILVDTTGLLPYNRLREFARRPAPVSVTYPNCPMTTGVDAIDYIFTDRWTCLPGQQTQYTEQAVFLPSGYLTYTLPDETPEITPLPAMGNKHVTFGIFQRFSKMNPKVWDLVAEVLRRCRNSRLLIQNNHPTIDEPDSRSRMSVTEELVSRDIDPKRLTLIGARRQRDRLKFTAQTDIALDTFPYQGQTTTCESLWMGVPVIARSGCHHVARVGTAVLERVGLGRLAADSDEEYVRRAVSLAEDLPALERLRRGMRDRLRGSTVLDGRNLAREAEDGYRRMWQAMLEGRRLEPDFGGIP
jgi:predicted O-linked N-acetylglucosamine transferase (SPINDLY family)